MEIKKTASFSPLLEKTLSYAEDLIRFPSVTPREEGCLSYLEEMLREWGFTCYRLPFGETGNLYARFGERAPHLGFLGHIDVVPPGPEEAWTSPPFEAVRRNNVLQGRGAVDMKGGIACFLSAVETFLPELKKGSLSLLITSDEEGTGEDGILKVKDWLLSKGERFEALLVGEPTSEDFIGDTLKIGRRGSLSGTLTVFGKQGHAAYPHKSDNPIPRLLKALEALQSKVWDRGSLDFQPSHLEITTIDVGNPATNVIPRKATAKFNIRFNPVHGITDLQEKIRAMITPLAGDHHLGFDLGSEPFLSKKSSFHELVSRVVREIQGKEGTFSTSGGTSDARHMYVFGPILELGLKNETAHKIDEHASFEDLEILSRIYLEILKRFYA